MFKESGGVPVRSGGVTTYGHWTPEGIDIFGGGYGEVSTTQQFLTIPAGKLPSVVTGTALTVDGDAYKINRHKAKSGGEEIVLEVRNA
jgi:hypothetical protein